MNEEWKSSAELYRTGEIERIPYDLSDPYDRAVWTALQLNADHLERLAAAQEGKRLYAMDAGAVWDRICFGNRRGYPSLFEESLRDLLSDVADGEHQVDPGELGGLASAIAGVLFSAGGMSSEPAMDAKIPPWFWSEPLEGEPLVAAETAPARPEEALAPLGRMTRLAHDVGIGVRKSHRVVAEMIEEEPEKVVQMVDGGELSAVRVRAMLWIAPPGPEAW